LEENVPKNVFVSYRREDSAASAGRLGDRLTRELGDGHVFMDVDGIPLGVNFVKHLTAEVATCDVLLAVIGPQWLDVKDDSGGRRLDDPDDFVRVEIRAALQRDIPVVPVLLDGTRIPKASTLPEDIRPLVFRNSLDLRHATFQKDLDRLVRQLTLLRSETTEPHKLADATSPPNRNIPRWTYVVVSFLLLVAGAYTWFSRSHPESDRNTAAKVVPQRPLALASVPCEEEKGLRAEATKTSTTISFINNTTSTRRIYWLDQNGARIRYSELESGQSSNQSTFVTHPWLVADGEDHCVEIYLPAPTPAVALLK
jgi:hypothetical protein